MAGSSFGTIFKITTWGESHGDGIGVVVDGCPAGIPLSLEQVQAYLNRRKPGQTRYSTPRKENDNVVIRSGLFEGHTTGTSILMAVYNETQRSADYSEIAGYYRPGHADFTYDAKYGFRDYRGGGRSSGRETIGRVAAGALAGAFLKELGITVTAYTKSIGPIQASPSSLTTLITERDASPLFMPGKEASDQAEEYLQGTMKEFDSAGGIIECIISGMPSGIGDPVFEKLDANLAKAIFSIGAVKGVEIGAGFSCATATGSKNNDAILGVKNGHAVKATNHAGGILGGISDGSDIILRAAIKPTPSIFKEQQTIRRDGSPVSVQIKGRHDPVIVPRAVVVVEAMAALVLADALLVNMGARMDRIREFYNFSREK
ncbi:MAG: chorismate synthase [Lachnospiraceae bacterium]|nr:chorismate synthase [Lachnospiraceae bacterium]